MNCSKRLNNYEIMSSVKATAITALFLLCFVVGDAVVKAASTGEDFEWLATTDNGVRIGGSGVGSPPAADTLEFTGGCGVIDFTGGGVVTFHDDGAIVSDTAIAVGAQSPAYETAGFFTATVETEGEEVGASLVGVNTIAGIASSGGDPQDPEYESVIQASIMCVPEGHVIVDLGDDVTSQQTAQASMQPSMQQSLQPIEQQSASTTLTERYVGPFRDALDWIQSQQ